MTSSQARTCRCCPKSSADERELSPSQLSAKISTAGRSEARKGAQMRHGSIQSIVSTHNRLSPTRKLQVRRGRARRSGACNRSKFPAFAQLCKNSAKASHLANSGWMTSSARSEFSTERETSVRAAKMSEKLTTAKQNRRRRSSLY